MRAAVVNPLHEEAAQQEQQPAKTRDWNLAKRLLLAAHRYFFAFLWGGNVQAYVNSNKTTTPLKAV